MSPVLDNSATLAWVYSDEITRAIKDLFDIVVNSGASVPVIWPLEVANSLQRQFAGGVLKQVFEMLR